MIKDQFAYSKLQESAQHNDNMAWLMSSILVVASISLLGFIITNLNKNPFLSLIGCSIGFFLIIVNMIIFHHAQEIKRQKYKKCKEIENKLDVKNNHKDTELLSNFSTYLYYVLLGIIAYSFIVIGLFLSAYS